MEVSFKNLGTVNKNRVTIGNLEIYFSYETPVAFKQYEGMGKTVCSENDWSKTTGKLLNEVCPMKKGRLPNAEFRAELEKAINNIKKDGF